VDAAPNREYWPCHRSAIWHYTRRSRTANKGLHFFFHYPDDGNTYKNAVGLNGKEGVDLRATGGYVVIPPSKLYGRLTYTWGNPEAPIAPLPIWLRDMLLTAQQQRESIPQGLRFAGSPGEYWLAQARDKARVEIETLSVSGLPVNRGMITYQSQRRDE
jgi:hypothetical protein